MQVEGTPLFFCLLEVEKDGDPGLLGCQRVHQCASLERLCGMPIQMGPELLPRNSLVKTKKFSGQQDY
jgi:hypothetical protein